MFEVWGASNTVLQQVNNTKKFGDLYSVNIKEETIIRDFVMKKYPILKEKQVLYKIAKVADQEYHDEASLHLPNGGTN